MNGLGGSWRKTDEVLRNCLSFYTRQQVEPGSCRVDAGPIEVTKMGYSLVDRASDCMTCVLTSRLDRLSQDPARTSWKCRETGGVQTAMFDDFIANPVG